MSRSVLAAASPPQEKLSAAGCRGSGAAAPDYGAEVSEVHKELTFLASGSKPFAGEAERSGKREYCAAFNEALPLE